MQAGQRLGILRTTILYVLRLIADDDRPFHGRQHLNILAKRAVGGDHDIHLLKYHRLFGPLGTMVLRHLETGHKAPSFTYPVLHQTCGAHHQRRQRLGIAGANTFDQTQRLQRFT